MLHCCHCCHCCLYCPDTATKLCAGVPFIKLFVFPSGNTSAWFPKTTGAMALADGDDDELAAIIVREALAAIAATDAAPGAADEGED